MRWPAAAVDRRTILIGGSAAIGLIVAFAAWPRRGQGPLRAGEGEEVFGPFLRIGKDGRVTVAVPQVETGQGVWTGLAQIAADELGADWNKVAVEPAPPAPDYANRLIADLAGTTTRLTALSSSVRAFEAPLREAAAMARHLLCAAAAARWGVDPATCDARDGAVSNGARSVLFGEIAGEAASLDPPRRVKLRTEGSGAIAGRSVARLDLPAKTDGSWRFAGDVRLPGIRFASVRIAPPNGRVAQFDRAAAKRTGAVRLIEGDGWLAAVGETSWDASRALDAAAPRFTGPADADTPAVEAALNEALNGPMDMVAEHGDYDSLSEGRRPLAATYWIAPAPHFSLDPPSVTVRPGRDRIELWAGTQAPDLARDIAAAAAGISPDRVSLYPMPVGDCGGRAVDAEAIAVAVAVALEIGVPLSLIFPAATGHNQDACRPPMAARISALPDPAGGIATWHARFAGAAGLGAAVARMAGKPVPEFFPHGGVPPYAATALRVEAATAALPIRTGYMRGDVNALTAFANESFIDELARARGVEPLAFRIGLLGGQPKLARVLTAAARIGGWDGGGRGSSLGLAACSAFGSHIALLAEASVGADQRVRVTRLVAAVDAGRLINPGLVRQQIEGGLLHALTTATGPPPEIIAGMVRSRPLGALGLATLKDLPKIEVALVNGTGQSGGVSGLGACVLPAAVANALFAATGLRLRRLPFDPMSPG
ncbi:MAG TPA: molybdopterin cofactor-binding domain-containing protein [Sphingomonas sp.]|nr:molybdopterin cofactor-binding domain-containing protein [Sphingomonas sp.]